MFTESQDLIIDTIENTQNNLIARFSMSLLKKRLDILMSAIDKKSSLSSLSYIKFDFNKDFVTASATDGELEISSVIQAQVFQEVSFLMPGKLFKDIVDKTVEEFLEIKTTNVPNTVEVSIEYFNCNISILDASEFASIRMEDGGSLVTIDALDLKETLKVSESAVSVDEVIYSLSGIYVHTKTIDNKKYLYFASTDCHRCAFSRINLNDHDINVDLIIPKRVVQEIIKAINHFKSPTINLTFDEFKFEVDYDDIKITSKLIDGVFPEYLDHVPSSFNNSFTVKKELIKHATERVALLSEGKYKAIFYDINDDCIIIKALSNSKSAQEKIFFTKKEGSVVNFEINSDYMLSAINVLNSEYLEFNLVDSDSPVVVKNQGVEDIQIIIMPVAKQS
jgi:DNA polymerase-3 subunit beta